MKTVRVTDNVVREIIPAYALPVAKWYGPQFAKECREAPDEVKQGWVYDPVTGLFSEPGPEPEPEPTPEERMAELEAQNALLTAQVQALSQQNDFHEELIVELANVVYA